ncbi:MAG: low specificity L-threonine aldolase [Bacteroidales bacterium]|nr:low specificity L-threonine aldolase [Bacteroidales bacterium]
MLYFDSDYMAGCHPTILENLTSTNLEHTPGYGSDHYTASAKAKILAACGLEDGLVLFLTGGTQTNATMLDALTAPHEGVVAAESAHINVHEAGAVEACGHKVLTLPSHDGKINPAELKTYVEDFYSDDTCEHMVAPGVVYLSQPTEYGTIYSLSELEHIKAICKSRDIRLYIDGARLGYALAAECNDVQLKDLARLADAFYIGGTKVGALFGEAVVISDKKILPHPLSFIKRHGALLAKGRLSGIQFDTLFTDGLYLEIGREAVRKALTIKQAFTAAGFRTFIDSPTNQQFFILPNEAIDKLKESASFEYWGPRGATHSKVRFVTSWSTPQQAIDELTDIISAL